MSRQMYTPEEVIVLVRNAINSDFYERDLRDDGDGFVNDMEAIIDEDKFNEWIQENLDGYTVPDTMCICGAKTSSECLERCDKLSGALKRAFDLPPREEDF